METKKSWRFVLTVAGMVLGVLIIGTLLSEFARTQRLVAFLEAIKSGDSRIVRGFLVFDKDFAREEINGLSVVELAMESRRVEVLKEILNALPRCTAGREGLPMLFIAAQKGTPAEIAEVIRWCPASPVTWRGETIVSWTIRFGKPSNARFLILILGSRSVMLLHPERFLL